MSVSAPARDALPGGLRLVGDAPFARGGFSHVFLGELQGVGAAAVKVMRHPGGEADAVARAARAELDVAGRFSHPNVVATLAANERAMPDYADGPGRGCCCDGADDEEYDSRGETATSSPLRETLLVSRLCPGGTLRAALRDGRVPCTRHDVLRDVAHQVANGLAYLHSLTVVHGDVKASNVLLSPCSQRPSGFSAQVADFGTSVTLGQGVANVAVDLFGGTPTHMAPEVLSKRVLSDRADVYSYGVLLWELAAGGAPPYDGVTPCAMALSVVRDGARPRFRDGAPAPLVALSTVCWHGKPEQRPCTLDIVDAIGLVPSWGDPCRAQDKDASAAVAVGEAMASQGVGMGRPTAPQLVTARDVGVVEVGGGRAPYEYPLSAPPAC